MEYPMITVIGNSSNAAGLDEVITHEVGHNWFYGLLASNERDHPWLDEGLNTFYEGTYMDKYYGAAAHFEMQLPKFLRNKLNGRLMMQGLRFFQVNNGHLPPDTHSDASSEMQYGVMSYMKPAQCMRWLQASMGPKVFRDMMRDYYAQWSFKHPQPADFQAVVFKHNPNAQWFFDQMQTRQVTDYAVKKVKKTPDGVEVTVKNRGDVASPFPLAALEQGRVVSQEWNPGFLGTQKVTMHCPEATAVFLDPDDTTLDLHRADNYKPVNGIRKPALRLFALTTEPKRAALGVAPAILWNYYDKTTIGAVVHTPLLPGRKLHMMLMPSYSIGSQSVTGAGEITYRYLPKGNMKTGSKVQYVQFGLMGRTFNRDYNWLWDQYLRFTKISPSVTIHMPNQTNSRTQDVTLRAVYLNLEQLDFDSSMLVGKIGEKWPIYEAAYTLRRKSLPNPSTTRVALEQQRYKGVFDRDASYLKTTLTHTQNLYYEPKKAVTMRIFAGYFLQNTQRDKNNVHNDFARGSLSLFPQGFTDYMHDGMFLGRSEDLGILARQVNETDGGFKVGNGSQDANQLGFSNDFAIAVNLKADLPKNLPFKLALRPYFDIGYTSDLSQIARNRTFSDKLVYSGGLNLSLFKGMMDVYFPLVNSSNLRRQYRTVGVETSAKSPIKWDYAHQISWSINLKALHPRTMLDGFSK
jgi:Peptidase family M1 domain